MIWEGVTNYLTQEAIDKTFEFVKRFPVNSFITFTYIHKQVLDNAQSFAGTGKLFENLKRNEEHWTYGFLPSELPGYLQQFGLTLLDDKDASEYREKYIPERKQLLNGYKFYRVAFACNNKRNFILYGTLKMQTINDTNNKAKNCFAIHTRKSLASIDRFTTFG